MEEKVVGIIGGMGPEATVDLMRRIIRATPALDDRDHVRMLVDNNPKVPSRIAALIEGNGESPLPCLQDMARRMVAWGVDFLAMPCNTAHYYHQAIQDAVPVPLLDMVAITVRTIGDQVPGLRRVGLLASTAVIRLGLYERGFARQDVDLVTPRESVQSGVMQAIKTIKTGRYNNEVVDRIQAGADDLLNRGADVLLVACTELSILGGRLRSALTIYDAAQILAEAILQEARGNGTEPRLTGSPPRAFQ